MKKCPYCGFNNPDSATVCINCGRSLIGVRDDNFIISPDQETSYIIDKEEKFYRTRSTSMLPFYVDVFFVLVVWGIVLIVSYLFGGDYRIKFFVSGSFTFIFSFFVELVLILTIGNSLGEVVTGLNTGWSRRKALVSVLAVTLFPLLVSLFLLV